MGTTAGYLAGWGLQLGYLATGIAAVLTTGVFGANLLTHFGVPEGNPWVWGGFFVLDMALALAVAIMDIKLSARTCLALEPVSVTILLILCVAIWVHAGGVFDLAQIQLTGVSIGGVFVGVVLAMFAFVGFESAGSLGMEARNPYRMVGRAILVSCILGGLFYVVVVYSQVFGFRGTTPGFAKSHAPLPDLAGMVGLGFMAPVIGIAILVGTFACTLACINAAARIAFAMAHDGMGVPALTRTHPTHRTPHVAIWTVGLPMLAVALILVLVEQSPVDGIGWVGTIATFGFMLAYALVSVAAPIFLQRLGLSAPLVTLAGVVGAVMMVVVFWANWLPQLIPGGLFPPLSGALAVLPYVFFLWMAVGLVWYAIVRGRNPELIRQLGTRFESNS